MSFPNDLNALNHSISWQTAVEMVNNYKTAKPGILGGSYGGAPDTLLDYETFNFSAIDNIRGQIGCIGFRIYMGLDSSNEIRSIIVGVDILGQDVIMTNGVCPLQACEEMGQRWP